MPYLPPENAPQYPSKRAMLREIAKTAAQVARDPRPAPRTLKEKRMEVCYNCDWFDPKQQRCRVCGCYMAGKAAVRGSKCPKGKWLE